MQGFVRNKYKLILFAQIVLALTLPNLVKAFEIVDEKAEVETVSNSSSNKTVVEQTNSVNIKNSIVAKAVSGNNQISSSENSLITTGVAEATVDIINVANINNATMAENDAVQMQKVGDRDDKKIEEIVQTTETSLSNTVVVAVNTGDNNITGSKNATIKTGDGLVKAKISNLVSLNIFSTYCAKKSSNSNDPPTNPEVVDPKTENQPASVKAELAKSESGKGGVLSSVLPATYAYDFDVSSAASGTTVDILLIYLLVFIASYYGTQLAVLVRKRLYENFA